MYSRTCTSLATASDVDRVVAALSAQGRYGGVASVCRDFDESRRQVVRAARDGRAS